MGFELITLVVVKNSHWFVEFGGHSLQQIIDIPMETNCKAEFIQNLIKDKRITETKAFNLTFRYTDDILSNKNSNLLIEFH
jgi:hypothetical protein